MAAFSGNFRVNIKKYVSNFQRQFSVFTEPFQPHFSTVNLMVTFWGPHFSGKFQR